MRSDIEQKRQGGNRPVLRVIAAMLLMATPVSANVAVPFAAFSWPISLLLLLPVIAIEAGAAVRILAVSGARGWEIAARANLVSTAVGLLVTAPAALVVPDQTVMLILGPLGFSPDEDRRFWLACAAAILVAVPSYFVSVWLEYRTARRFFEPDQAPLVWRWSRVANARSYVLVGLFYLYYFHYAAASWHSMNQKVRQVNCLSNLRQVAGGIAAYRARHHGTMPHASDFTALMRQVSTDTRSGAKAYRCPETRRTYLFNTALSGVRVASVAKPADTPMLRDAAPHPSGRVCVLFVDGSARAIDAADPRAARGRFR